MKKLVLMLLVCAAATCGFSQPAQAIPAFYKEYMKLYDVDKTSKEKSDFAKLVLKAKCFNCHQGKKKKNRNSYGAELSKLLDKKKDAKKPKRIVEALKKVAKMHTKPGDKKSATYADLIKAGKLPGGSLKDSKKESKKDSKKKESDSKDSNKQESDKKESDKKGSDKK